MCLCYEKLHCNHQSANSADTVANLVSNYGFGKCAPRVSHHSVVVCDFVQILAPLCVSEGPDAQTVGRVQLLHKERAAGLHYRSQLQQTGSRQQALNGVLPQLQTPCSQTQHTG